MRTIIISKIVNNTEVGKGGTNETYILVPQELDVSEIFPNANEKIVFLDPIRNERKIRLTIGREKRIVGLGPFYKEALLPFSLMRGFYTRNANGSSMSNLPATI